ncbi:hypothetical protein D7V88_00555 [Corallococcus terminator]|uniref:Uncharacterized protein n=2 Tax=Corallococcus terminator TaxID=2316733 RepID=A0A3A8JFC9_9BACT|nr:hypothetical protein D7V88_00555 [Corallococcus terminator]
MLVVALAILFLTILLVFFALVFAASAGDAEKYARVRREGQRHTAVITDCGLPWNTRNQAWVLLKLETPSGSVAKRLYVPLEGAVSYDFLATARVTNRPVYVLCILDERVDESVRHHGYVLEQLPGGRG